MWTPDIPGEAILFLLFDFTIKGLHLKGLHKVKKENLVKIRVTASYNQL